MSDFTAKSPGKSGTAIFYATNASAVGVDVHLDKFVFCYQKCELDSSQPGQRDFICSGTRTALQQAAEQCMSLSPDVIVSNTSVYTPFPIRSVTATVGACLYNGSGSLT